MKSAAIVATVAARAASLCGGVLASIITARALGPEGRGQYYYVVVLAGLAVQFGTLGLHASNTYLVAKQPGRLSVLIGNNLLISLSVGLAAAVVVGAVLISQKDFHLGAVVFLWVAIYVPSGLFLQLTNAVIVGLDRIMLYNGAQLLLSGIMLAGLFAAREISPTVVTFVGAFAIAHGAIALGLTLAIRKGTAIPLRFDTEIFREGFKFSLKSFAVSLMGFLVARMNVLLLEHMQPPAQLGYYSLGMQLFDAISLIPASMGLILFPNLVRSQSAWPETRRHAWVVGIMLCIACALPIPLLSMVIGFVFGPQFLPAMPAVLLLLPAAVFVGVTTIFSQYLAAQGLPSSVLAIWLTATAIAAVSGYILVPSHGAAGAACALSLTYLATALMMGGLSYAKSRAVGLGVLGDQVSRA